MPLYCFRRKQTFICKYIRYWGFVLFWKGGGWERGVQKSYNVKETEQLFPQICRNGILLIILPPPPLSKVCEIQICVKQNWVAFMSQPYWVEVMVEVELRMILRLRLIWNLNLRLKWGRDEIQSKFSWTWVEVELSCSWDKLTLNKGRNLAFIGVGLWFKNMF